MKWEGRAWFSSACDISTGQSYCWPKLLLFKAPCKSQISTVVTFFCFVQKKLGSCFELNQMAQFELEKKKKTKTNNPHGYSYKFVSSFRRLKTGCEFQGKG